MPTEDITKDDKVDQLKHKDKIIQQEQNQSDLPQEWRTHHYHPIKKVIGALAKEFQHD